jgi:hypothetical protein
MTAGTVDIIITIRTENSTKEIYKKLEINELESNLSHLNKEIGGELSKEVLSLVDQQLRQQVPSNWKNVGQEKRSIQFEHGYTTYYRRIYRDEQGVRRKPLDELMNVKPYVRNSQRIQEIGCVLAANSTYRMAAQNLSFLTRQYFSPNSIQRMVWKLGSQICQQENEFQSTKPGRISTEILYGESDGVWIHYQRENKKKAEVRVAVMYTGKKGVGKTRNKLHNKVVLTQLGGSSKQWQEKLRELADSHYDLQNVKLLVTGGDGSAWVKQSFDLLNIPQTHLLDRFHLMRALRQAFGHKLSISVTSQSLFSQGFDAVSDQLLACIAKAKENPRKYMIQVYKYLQNNQDSLLDLDQRGLPYCSYGSLGAIEGNVDKLVVHRMEGRGCCWRVFGATAMLAILRHKDALQNHAFHYHPVMHNRKRSNRVVPNKEEQIYLPKSGSLPMFRTSDRSLQWIQLLKKKLDDNLSLTAFY